MVGGVLYSSALSKYDISLIDSLLNKKNLSLNDLNFEKDWASSTKLKLPIVVKILNNPLYFPVFVDSVQKHLDSSRFDLHTFSKLIFTDIKKEKIENSPIKLPDATALFDFIYQFYSKAFYHQQLAFINLSQKEKKELLYLSYNLLAESEDSLRYKDFYTKHKIAQFDSLESADIIHLIQKINFAEFYKAAQIFYSGFHLVEEITQKFPDKFKQNIYRNTRFGKFIISVNGDDIYQDKYAFILDFSGDDTYKCDFNTDFYHPFLIQLDFSGNDKYQSLQIGGLFDAVFGFIGHIDYAGNDVYLGDDYAFSAWLGYMLSYDKDGDDFYKGGLHSLGAATLGISYLNDDKGDDIYSATEFAQGFASVLGVGILQDNGGDDVYYCGGKYLHAPLAPNDYRTMSHGYGFGLRPDIGGGVGILYDKQGNDYYDGGVFSIGGAYWYALGIVIDKAGNDFYNSVYYPQGSGIHLAGGFLYDEAGEDEYYSKHGPGMGAGHDYSVGFLIDNNGNDQYSVEGGLGLGLTNSVGIFVDKNGNDKYVSKYPKNLGWANKSRDTGGIGIFLDENGDDEYSNDFAKNNSEWQRGYFGFALDIDNKVSVKEKAKESVCVALVDSLAPIKEIFKIASGWGVNSNAKRVDRALEILVKREKEAAKYIAENKMNTKSGLTYRAIKKFAKKSKEFRSYFPELLQDADTLVIKNTISLIATMKDSTYLDKFEEFLQKKKYEKTILSALGDINTKRSVQLLSKYIDSKNEKFRIIVARSLFKINNKLAKKELEKLRNDKSFLIKAMFMIREQKERK